MKYLLPVISFMSSVISFSQAGNFREVDEYVLALKVDSDISVQDLAVKLTEPFDTDILRTRAVYAWIAANIEYEHTKVVPGLMASYPSDQEEAFNAFRNRKGDCRGYSHLFRYMLGVSGIKSRVIRGYIRKEVQDSLPGTPNHAWNAVSIDDEWHLFDVTWARDKDNKVNGFWFMTDPETFSRSHYPANVRSYRRIFPGADLFFQD